MKVVVTGGSGKLGRYIVSQLREKYEVRVFDRRKPPVEGKDFFRGDITKLDDLKKAFEGMDAVIHLAAIPHPLADPPEKVMKVNAMGTFCTLEAAAQCGVKRVVAASSESTFGFVFRRREFSPEYVPLNESHPLKPQDPYGLSKLVGEEICKTYARGYGITTICIRPCFIWFPEYKDNYAQLVDNPERWWKNLWVYVHVLDVVQAFELALEAEGISHDAFLIAAEDIGVRNWKTVDLLRKYYPDVKRISKRLTGNESLLDCSKAKKILGYRPKYTWRDLGI
ncbi:MAG: NAD-dependent epimerase/dehydratase family protein [bacterium]